MAHFRGLVQGARGEASRLGHQRLQTTAQAWGGQIVVVLWRETLGDTPGDYVRISVEGNGATYNDTGNERTLYCGPLIKLRELGITFDVTAGMRDGPRKDAQEALAKFGA